MDRDPLLDRPRWAPWWVPSVDDVRQVRWLRWVLGGVFATGIMACVVRGADRPEDPTLGAPEAVEQLAMRIGTAVADLVTATGDTFRLCLLDADTPDERRQGLMGVDDLGGYDGMLFRHDAPVESSFIMADTLIPLTVVFFDGDGDFVSRQDMVPCSEPDPLACTRYAPEGPFRWAVEFPAGAADELGIDASSQLFVEGSTCSPV